MYPEEFKCFWLLFLIAGITICIVFPFGPPYYVFISYYPLGLYFVIVVMFIDFLLSIFLILKTRKIVKEKYNV